MGTAGPIGAAPSPPWGWCLQHKTPTPPTPLGLFFLVIPPMGASVGEPVLCVAVPTRGHCVTVARAGAGGHKTGSEPRWGLCTERVGGLHQCAECVGALHRCIRCVGHCIAVLSVSGLCIAALSVFGLCIAALSRVRSLHCCA